MHTERGRAAHDPADGRETAPAGVLVISGAAHAPGLRRALESGGACRPTWADGLDAGLDALRAGGFDAVLVDVDLSEVSRAAGVRRVRQAAPDAALIAVGDGDAARAAVALGADEWIARSDCARYLPRCVRGAVERRRLRAERDASEARFRNVIHRTADGIVIVGQDGRVRFLNPAAERLFGRAAAELMGEEFGIASVAGETVEIDIVRRGEPEPLVAELRASDTSWEGEAAQVISLRDITDRKRAEDRKHRLLLEQAARAEAERAERRSRFLAEAASALDASLDAETNLASLAGLVVPRMADWCVIDLLEGERIRRVAGVHAEPEKQGLIEELKRLGMEPGSPAPSARVLRAGVAELHRGLDAGTVRKLAGDDAHARLLLALGFRSCMIVPLPARGHWLGAITFACSERDFDESDLALAEEIASRAGRALENARLYAAALAANRAKTDFLAVMSHELRTPLNAILGYTQILLDGVTGGVDERHIHPLRRIESCAAHLLQMIEEILAYAEMEAGRTEARPERIRLGDLMDGLAATAEPLAAEKGLRLVHQVRHPDALLFTDAGRLRQVVLNLLSNAVKFTESGTIRLDAELTGDQLVIAVADTGVGIAPESMEAIFEPFRQAEQALTRQAGGTGIGLSVSQRLAEMLGGAVTAVSEQGAGSTFAVRVPARLPMGNGSR